MDEDEKPREPEKTIEVNCWRCGVSHTITSSLVNKVAARGEYPAWNYTLCRTTNAVIVF